MTRYEDLRDMVVCPVCGLERLFPIKDCPRCGPLPDTIVCQVGIPVDVAAGPQRAMPASVARVCAEAKRAAKDVAAVEPDAEEIRKKFAPVWERLVARYSLLSSRSSVLIKPHDLKMLCEECYRRGMLDERNGGK